VIDPALQPLAHRILTSARRMRADVLTALRPGPVRDKTNALQDELFLSGAAGEIK
jgi:hypothetical protein